ncbi:MAG: hypothetical protein KGL39_57800 [Patescibacteria group bacterium]|nr:hypothetical protein [Patescibacteria group bacterium]
MKNKMELLQAAQKHAAETMNVSDPVALLQSRLSTFNSFGISTQHWNDFQQMADAARSAYSSLSCQPLKPAQAAA